MSRITSLCPWYNYNQKSVLTDESSFGINVVWSSCCIHVLILHGLERCISATFNCRELGVRTLPNGGVLDSAVSKECGRS